ncbi:MAG: alpha-L-arabinofuranosidase C-terminal domain-containing protein [Blastocatellia bacterium]|nr:alpha-L-arabinofuranosidase C-terminal domain-containing protein [Blastocatellia bacterium]
MKRRRFVGMALTGGVACLAGGGAALRQAKLADARVEILLNEPIGRIAPEVYGHFAEHLGGVIYDGIWVGENSKIPNLGGIRKALVDALKRIKPGVIRWPGGCFADSYNWRDGIGPRAQRPRRTNFWVDAGEWPAGAPDGPWKYDTNHFGTDEFLRFCQLSDAQPYLAANLRSLTARDFYEFVEYCNSPAGSTTLAEMRAAGGQAAPYKVRFWGVGNESWGCGGNFTPEEYAAEYRRFSEWVPRYGGNLSFIGSGPNGGDLSWSRRFFGRMAERGGFNRMWGWGLHHYSWNASSGKTTDWRLGKGDALRFPDEEWYEMLAEGEKIESLINDHWAIMGEFDRQHRVKLVVDEWGTWFKPGTELHPSHLLGQQSTMRDAVLAGMTLDTFHRHADKVAMANIAQLVNCLQALFFAHEDKFTVTPTYHVFDLFAAHQGAQSVRTVVSAPRSGYTRNGAPASIRGLSGSASVQQKQLTLTITNPDLAAVRETEIVLRGASVREVEVTTLSAADPRAHNTFEAPRAVEPKPGQATRRSDGTLTCSFAPASVTRLKITIA